MGMVIDLPRGGRTEINLGFEDRNPITVQRKPALAQGKEIDLTRRLEGDDGERLYEHVSRKIPQFHHQNRGLVPRTLRRSLGSQPGYGIKMPLLQKA